MVSQPTLFPIAIHASLLIFRKESLSCSTFDLECQLHSPRKRMAKQKRSTSQSNYMFKPFATTSKTTGGTYYLQPSTVTTPRLQQERGCHLFDANYGYHPRTTWPTKEEVKDPASEVYTHYVHSIHELCKEGLEKACKRMAKYYDSESKKHRLTKLVIWSC